MWQEKDGKLVKEFTFPDFKTALEFVDKIGREAEAMNHHPDIELGWGRVKLSLMTHSEGGVTAKDHRLAEAIDKL